MSDAILGAIVGAASAISGSTIAGILAEILKNILQVKRENRQSLICGCENAKRILFLLKTDPKNLSDELIMETKIKLSIYASPPLIEAFNSITESLALGTLSEKKISEFNNLIKRELKIKH